MVIHLYPINENRGIWSFRPQPNAKAIRVRVPAGSALREVKTVGLVLFVPGEDPAVLGGWSANQVMREIGGRFSLVGSGKLARAVG